MGVGRQSSVFKEAKQHDLLSSPTGQIVGMLKDRRPAKEIFDTMVNGAVELLNMKLPATVKARRFYTHYPKGEIIYEQAYEVI